MTGAFHVHGGRLTEACAVFGGAAQDWLDLSTGINPAPWHNARLSIDWAPLPDPEALTRLERQAARHFSVDPHLCCAVPGSEVGLRLLAHLLGLPGRHAPLSYSTHADAFERAAPITPYRNGSREASVLVIANPNNPDGRVTPRKALLSMLARQEANGGWLVVDEAFADCRPDWSISSQVTEARRLIVLRSFGKFFGLAGVRLGFVIGTTDVVNRTRQLLGEWPIHAAALTLGTAAYTDRDWIAATRRELPIRAARLDAVLIRHGLDPQGDCPLFRLAHTSDALRLFALLARRHILTRPFAAHPHLLRFGLPPDDESLARLDAALSSGLADG
ncbi:MAG TPA: aminotransferase class I/II-fold pyridoxal phosphate-dependent enzyme [Novosphingobium sp.]|nr:aminotransferase class I/II-fold pyridoxal phosphate-dependent enzyme [Novosphingobium sp.]